MLNSIYIKNMIKIKLNILIENEVNKQLLSKIKDVKIKNPETNRQIKVTTALADKNHPAYQTALNLINKNESETIENIEVKIQKLKKEYDLAQDNYDFDKVSIITKQIQDLNKKKSELEQTNKPTNDTSNITQPTKRFKNKTDILDYIKSEYNHIPDPLLKKTETKAAGIYRSDDGYKQINGHLRNNTDIDDNIKKNIEDLNKAIKKSKLKEDTTLYRGLKLNDSLKEQLSKLKIGDSFSDNGFSSTSFDENMVTKNFVGENEGAIFQINAKKGQYALPLENIKASDDGDYTGEAEMLLPTKSSFKLIGKEGNKYIFELE